MDTSSDHFPPLPPELLHLSWKKALFFLLSSLLCSFIGVYLFFLLGIDPLPVIFFAIAILGTGFSASFQVFPVWKYVFPPFWMFLGAFFWGFSFAILLGFFLIGWSFWVLYISFQQEMKSQILLSFYKTANVALSKSLLIILLSFSFFGAWFFSVEDIFSYFTERVKTQISTVLSAQTGNATEPSFLDQAALTICRGDEECLSSIKEKLSFSSPDSSLGEIKNPLQEELNFRTYLPDSFNIVFTSQLIGKAILFLGFFFFGMSLKGILVPIVSGFFSFFGFFLSLFGIFKKSERMTMQEYFV